MKIKLEHKFVYRYLPIYRLIDILSKKEKKKNLAFLSPSKYKIHDPFEGWLFEKLFAECSKKYPPWAKYKEFERKIFFLCLSSDSETDQIWKTYTPHALGVCQS